MEKVNVCQNDWKILISYCKIISELSKENIKQSAQAIINKMEEDHLESFYFIISQMVLLFYSLRKNEYDLYLNFLKEIEENNKSNPKIFNIFTNYLLNQGNEESKYILEKMIQNNILEPKIVQKRKFIYFAHYISENKINKLFLSFSRRRNPYFDEKINHPFGRIYVYNFVNNYKELSKNDWELHKKLIEEGVNPNEIAKIIQNDEIEKLQEISSQQSFNFNQKISPSLYERCSYINQEKVTLIDYAAYFGSIKCFKYLLMNGSNVKNTGKYAVAGGNEEIIHLCEQNHSSFQNAYETAIQFHRNNIFKYLYENKIKEIDNLEDLGKKCIIFHNYEIFILLQEKGMKISENIINESARIGNLFLVKYFLEENPIPKNILIFASNSINIELVKYILDQEEIDVNTKDICLFRLIFFEVN